MIVNLTRRLALTLGLVVSSGAALPVAAGDRVTFAAEGGLAALKIDWISKAKWEAWKENATVESRHAAAAGVALEGALGCRVTRHLGVVLAMGQAARDARLNLDARVPHPLFLERPRTVTATLSGRRYRELSGHLDLEWREARGRFEIAAFAGQTVARIETDLVQRIQVTEAYPYDEATFLSAETTRLRSRWAAGWNGGAGAAWLASSRFDLGVVARYTRVPVELSPATGETVKLTAGGLQVVARVRARF